MGKSKTQKRKQGYLFDNDRIIKLNGDTKVENHEMRVAEHDVPNTIFKIKTIVTEKTYKNINKSVENIDFVDYDNMKDFVKKHKDELFDKNKRYKINVLGVQGWRSGKTFYGDDYDFYDPAVYYGDDFDALDEVSSIVIIEIPK